MTRAIIFGVILLVGMPIILASLWYAQKHQRVSFFGLNPTSRAEDPGKFDRIVRSYKLQMLVLPVVAAVVSLMMDID